MPAEVPTIWGMVARNPNWSPDAHSRALFGPGVTELTNANRMRAWRSLMPPAGSTWLQYSRPRSARLVRSLRVRSRLDRAGSGLEAAGARHQRGAARRVSRARVPASHARHVDGLRRRRRADPIRPRPPPSWRGALDGRRAPTSRRSRRAHRDEPWLPQASDLRRDEPSEREPDRPRGRSSRRSRTFACVVASTFCTSDFVIPTRHSRRRPTSHSWPSASGRISRTAPTRKIPAA